MILVTGAAGKTGREVIKRLAARGHHVRALVRRQEQADSLKHLGAVDFVVGDMGASDIMDKALAGVRAVYHICPNMHPAELAIGENAIRVAQAAGVERFVYHSVLHPQIERMAHHWQKMRVEEKLFESGLALYDFTAGGLYAECAGELGADCWGGDLCCAVRAGYAAEHG